MFTGLVEETGILKSLERGGQWARVTLRASKVLADLSRGDSVAVNGVCLTATDIDSEAFSADVMAETLSRTNLGELRPGSKVNLERALAVGGRLGGHIVSGHVDGVGILTQRRSQGPSTLLFIDSPLDLCRFIVSKGSITVDGVSLTVVERKGSIFSVSLVTHTLSATTLADKAIGDRLNLEVDVIARYLAGLLEAKDDSRASGRLSEGFLAEHGFL